MGTMSTMSRSAKAPRKARSKRSPTKQSGTPEAEYRVGPGRPPREFRFKPGESGNPVGAKKKPRSPTPDVKAMLETALNMKIKVKEGDRERNATRLAIGLEQLANKFARGDRYARRDVFELAERFGVDLAKSLSLIAGSLDQAAVSAHDEAILEDYVRRQIAEREQRDDVSALPPPDGEETDDSQIERDLT
jgi:Family of unknown function (DUF5681)